MAQDQRERTEEVEPAAAAPRLRAVACLSGVSLERGVSAGEIHDYIQEIDNVVWVDVQDRGPRSWRCSSTSSASTRWRWRTPRTASAVRRSRSSRATCCS